MTLASPSSRAALVTVWPVIGAVALCHLMNDTLQSILAAIYPLIQAEFSLDYWQIGLISFAFQVTASLLQPVVGAVTDRRPMPQSTAIGMAASLAGVVLLAFAPSYALILLAAMLVGLGSAVFHPEASRISRAAAGRRLGTAQSFFQVGGNAGTALGPLLAAFIVVPLGRAGMGWFALMAGLAILVLWRLGLWYAAHRRSGSSAPPRAPRLEPGVIRRALVILALLTFAKNAYQAAMGNYLTFYVIETFGLGTQGAQLVLFLFLGAGAVGVLLGGLVGDRVGPLTVIWVSILGCLPFTLALPYVGLELTCVFVVLIGVIMASAFPAILVFAQELVPHRLGLVTGVFFGFAFGMAGISAAALGVLADFRGLAYVYWVIGFLPILGVLTVFLPRGVLRPQPKEAA